MNHERSYGTQDNGAALRTHVMYVTTGQLVNPGRSDGTQDNGAALRSHVMYRTMSEPWEVRWYTG